MKIGDVKPPPINNNSIQNKRHEVKTADNRVPQKKDYIVALSKTVKALSAQQANRLVDAKIAAALLDKTHKKYPTKDPQIEVNGIKISAKEPPLSNKLFGYISRYFNNKTK